MSECSGTTLLDAPGVVECSVRITAAYMAELRRLEVAWASPSNCSVGISNYSPRASIAALDSAAGEAASPFQTSLLTDEPPPFLEFDAVPESPIDAALPRAREPAEFHHVPARVVDYATTNGERVLVDVSDDFLGEGAVAKIYKGTLCLLHQGEAETAPSRRIINVACRVQRLEQWLTDVVWLAEMAHRWHHPCVLRAMMTTIHDRAPATAQADPWKFQTASVVSVLEIADGGSLKDAISAKGSLTVSEIRDVLHDMLSALQYIHEEFHIVHNDVKPGNILISSHSCATQRPGVCYKLSDFDCAAVLEPITNMSKRLHAVASELPPSGPAARAGTILYMAPEISLGLCRFAANDVWSLGITTFCMVTGTVPWRQMERQIPELITHGYRDKFVRANLFQQSVEREAAPNSSSDFGPDLSLIMSDLNCPPLLRQFICDCLVEDPRRRPTCRQLLQHPFLSNIEQHAPSSTC